MYRFPNRPVKTTACSVSVRQASCRTVAAALYWTQHRQYLRRLPSIYQQVEACVRNLQQPYRVSFVHASRAYASTIAVSAYMGSDQANMQDKGQQAVHIDAIRRTGEQCAVVLIFLDLDVVGLCRQEDAELINFIGKYSSSMTMRKRSSAFRMSKPVNSRTEGSPRCADSTTCAPAPPIGRPLPSK